MSGKKYTLYTAAFYLAYLVLILIGLRHLVSGPCNPGWGFLVLAFTPFLSGGALLVGVGRRLFGRKGSLGPMIIHGAVLLISILIYWWFDSMGT
jgi:hypothetical protein